MARLVALLAIVCCLELASAARSTILAGQTWTIRGDKAGTADSASQNPSVDAVPKAPVFPNSYEVIQLIYNTYTCGNGRIWPKRHCSGAALAARAFPR